MPQIDVLMLEGVIVALFGIVTALAKVAWSERGATVTRLEKRVSYYEEQVMPTMNRVLDASEEQQRSIAVMSRVVEDGLKRVDKHG